MTPSRGLKMTVGRLVLLLTSTGLLLTILLSSSCVLARQRPARTPRQGKLDKRGGRWKEGDLRLVRGRARSQGVVLLYHKGKWGAVCDDLWNVTNSDVVCRQKGFSAGSLRTPMKMEFSGRARQRMWITRVRCQGHEKRLLDCDYVGWGKRVRRMCPGKWRAVGVVCHPNPQSFTDKKKKKKRVRRVNKKWLAKRAKTRQAKTRKAKTRKAKTRKTIAEKKKAPKAKTTKATIIKQTEHNYLKINADAHPKSESLDVRISKQANKETPTLPKTTSKPLVLQTQNPWGEFTTQATDSIVLVNGDAERDHVILRPFAMYADLADMPARGADKRTGAAGDVQFQTHKPAKLVDLKPGYKSSVKSSVSSITRTETKVTTSSDTTASTMRRSSEFTTTSTTSTIPPTTTTTTSTTTTTTTTTASTTPETTTTTTMSTTSLPPPPTTTTTTKATTTSTPAPTTPEPTTTSTTASTTSTTTPQPPPPTTTTTTTTTTTPSPTTITTATPSSTTTTPSSTTTTPSTTTTTTTPSTTTTTTTTPAPTTTTTTPSPPPTTQKTTSIEETTTTTITETTESSTGESKTATPPTRSVSGTTQHDDVLGKMLTVKNGLHYQADSPSSRELELRLTGGRYRWEGRLEVREVSEDQTPGPWGTVCGTEWGIRETMVVCRQLGLNYAKQAYRINYFRGDMKSTLFYSFNCTGRESTLSMCPEVPISDDNDCPSANTVAGVICATYLPDLIPDTERLQHSVRLQDRPLYYLQCAMEENCLSSSAYEIRNNGSNWRRAVRRLLRFSTVVHNRGDADFRPNVAKGQWEWHTCHMHYHSMEEFAHYDIMDREGRRLAEGTKASFCLEDTTCDRGVSRNFACEHFGDQGLSVNCSDNYLWDIDCQWIDITDIEPGIYTFLLEVNPSMLVAEKSFDNNIAHCDLWYSGYEAKFQNCHHESLLDYHR